MLAVGLACADQQHAVALIRCMLWQSAVAEGAATMVSLIVGQLSNTRRCGDLEALVLQTGGPSKVETNVLHNVQNNQSLGPPVAQGLCV